MTISELRDLFDKVNDGAIAPEDAAEVTIDLAKFTKELERRWNA